MSRRARRAALSGPCGRGGTVRRSRYGETVHGPFVTRWSLTGAVLATLAITATCGAAASAAAAARPLAPTIAPTIAPANPPIYVTAMRDALAASSLHEVQRIVSSGYSSVNSEDAVVNGGTETDTITSSSTSFGFTARLYNDHLYLNADQLTLIDLVGLSAFDGGYNAGRWLVVPQSSKVFGELAFGIDVVRAVAQIELGPGVKDRGLTTFRGHRVIALTSDAGLHASAAEGYQAGSFTLYVTTGKHPLPLAEVISDHNGTTPQRVTLIFSRWNDPVSIARPVGAIPLP